LLRQKVHVTPIAFVRETKLINYNCSCHTSTIVIKYCIIEPRRNNDFKCVLPQTETVAEFFKIEPSHRNFLHLLLAEVPESERVPFSIGFQPSRPRLPGVFRGAVGISGCAYFIRVIPVDGSCGRIRPSTLPHRHASRTMQRLWFIEWRAGAADLTPSTWLTTPRSERASHAAYDGKTKEANNFGQFRGSRARPAKQRDREREKRERERDELAWPNEWTTGRSIVLQQRDATHRARGATCNAARPPPPTTVRLSIGEHPGGSHPDSPFARLFALFAVRSVTNAPSRSRARLRSRSIITITNTPLGRGCLRLTTLPLNDGHDNGS